MDEIIINVEFEKENAWESLTNEVQVVPADISWEDFELMVGLFLMLFSCCVMWLPKYSFLDYYTSL